MGELLRCEGCGAVGSDWLQLPSPAVAIFAAISAPPMVALAWALSAYPTVFRTALALALAAAGYAVYTRLQKAIGERVCRYCRGEAFAAAHLACPRHGDVRFEVRRRPAWKVILVVPLFLLLFAFAGTKDPEVAHLTGPCVVAALCIAGFVLAKTRRPGASCGCDDATPAWLAARPAPAAPSLRAAGEPG